MQNPDETVMVSFVTKASNVKKSFPVTHHKLLTGDDLSSPESSDEELETQQRESFTTPGFDRLDSQAFEEFGLDVKDIDQMREEKEREWKRSMDDLDGMSQSSGSTLKADDEGEEGEEGDAPTKLEFEGGKGEGLQLPLTKWKKIHSLNRLNSGSVVQKPDTTDLDELEGVSSTDTLVIHEDQETRDIFQLGSVAVYDKMPREQERPTASRSSAEGSSTEVLKLVTQMEGSKADKQRPAEVMRGSPEKIPSGVVRSGSVSDRLKLFGGGVRSSKPPPKPLKQPLLSPLSQVHRKDVTSAESTTQESKSKLIVETSSQSLEQTDSGHVSTATEPPHDGVKPKRGSAFETITEETVGDVLEEKEDRVAPLPKIHPGLVRRHSQERFRLDGLKPPPEIKPQGGGGSGDLGQPVTTNDGKYSPPKMRLLKQGDKEFETQGRAGVEARKEGSSPPFQEKRKIAPVYSPLMVSSDANSSKVGQKGGKGRPVSDPSHRRGSESLALYMNSANLPHLNHLRERYHKEEGEQAEGRVESLLEGPRCTGESVPVEFRGVLEEEGKMVYIWKQKVHVCVCACGCVCVHVGVGWCV